jgi:hypothetical protein
MHYIHWLHPVSFIIRQMCCRHNKEKGYGEEKKAGALLLDKVRRSYWIIAMQKEG